MADFREYSEYKPCTDDESCRRSVEFLDTMKTRRTVRQFSSRPVPGQVLENCLRVAVNAPSGANQQPWTFVVVEESAVRRRLREAAEEEERQFYEHRAPQEWLNAVEPFGTDSSKPFLEEAPVVIVVFSQSWRAMPDGSKGKHYYVAESVGIATGFLITAMHVAGLATLTHTPSPMAFLNQILGRPENERPYLILVAGYPMDHCRIPVIEKKDFGEVVVRL
ncbi:MAG: nitroreductase family protein [Planctomycetaceae bacterium]|nr:nitroreductase family protein [Planctomycetaceae bacterium]